MYKDKLKLVSSQYVNDYIVPNITNVVYPLPFSFTIEEDGKYYIELVGCIKFDYCRNNTVVYGYFGIKKNNIDFFSRGGTAWSTPDPGDDGDYIESCEAVGVTDCKVGDKITTWFSHGIRGGAAPSTHGISLTYFNVFKIEARD
jgi:hypothetical protein